MNLPQGYTATPATLEDLDDYVALFEAWDLVDAGRVEPVREHLHDDLASSALDLALDTRAVRAADGAIAALAQVATIDPTSSFELYVVVHPGHRGRGIGTASLEWMEARAAERIPDGASPPLYNVTSSTDASGIALLTAHGYRRVRTFWHMEGDLASGAEAIGGPAGTEIRALRVGVEDRAFYDTIEEAFRGHFGWNTQPYQDWHRDVMEVATFDAHGCFVAMDGGRMVGAVLARVTGDEGYIDDLGVLAERRGSGIGEALLRRAFAELAGRGLAHVSLNVDSTNETGATRLYERVGMRVRRAWPVYEKRLPAG